MGSKLRLIYTIGQIAQRLNEPIHRVEYAVRTRRIEPVALAGNLRVFEEEQIERIAAALREIDEKREGGTQCTM